jgi:hypothetical protein
MQTLSGALLHVVPASCLWDAIFGWWDLMLIRLSAALCEARLSLDCNLVIKAADWQNAACEAYIVYRLPHSPFCTFAEDIRCATNAVNLQFTAASLIMPKVSEFANLFMRSFAWANLGEIKSRAPFVGKQTQNWMDSQLLRWIKIVIC